MAQSLEQYAESLDLRKDLTWPAPPEVERLRAKPHLKKLADIRVVLWNVYGTLLSITPPELLIDHPNRFVMEVALDKTIQEFKMWKSMTRKPGTPADVLLVWYRNIIDELKLTIPAGERSPEYPSHEIWKAIVKKLMTNEYTYLASQYGDLDEYAQKIAYFFHASLQGVAAQEGAARAVFGVNDLVGKQGLLADGQCFTWAQALRCLKAQEPAMDFAQMLPKAAQFFSWEHRCKKPTDRLFKAAVVHYAAQGVEPHQILHVGSHLHHDIVPARRHGFRTALYAGDKSSLRASTEELKKPELRPDALLTELPQLLDCLG